MPRDIPVGNGRMLVTFDHHYQMRDLYYPHVGQENHAGGGPCRFGVWGELVNTGPRERRRQRTAWTSDGWKIELGYQPDTLTTDASLRHEAMALSMRCNDTVDFHRDLLVRRIEIRNEHDQARALRIFSHADLHMFGTKVGDTAYYDPKLRMMVHYRQKRYVMMGFFIDGELRIDAYATGNSGYGGAEGTWRDAEDGELGNNAIAQGAVDSTIAAHVDLAAAGEPGDTRVLYLLIGCGRKHEDLAELHRFIHRDGPQAVIDRTGAYWRLWCWANNWDFADLPEHMVDLFRRSLLVLRTQIDNNGSIIAANDSDIMQFQRDTYSYMWPRDGALVAHVLDLAGYPEVTRRFYQLAAELITPGGYFLHKYNPDGSPASSWHPWVVAGRTQLPIQEDETALVVWALWQHYYRYRDVESVRPLWMRLIKPVADFMARFRDPATGLPLPSYDLWEERWGVHAFTVGAVYGGLLAATNFATCFADHRSAQAYRAAAAQVRQGFLDHFWCDDEQRYLRRIEPLDTDRTGRLIDEATSGRDPRHSADAKVDDELEFYRDKVIDSSLFGIYKFQLAEASDPRVAATMQAVEQRLWIKTTVGGVARYDGDPYHSVTDNTRDVPGNPWFICTLWLADWHIARATSVEELQLALPVIDWVNKHALRSGVLAEQVHPQTNAALSVSPLTWSHATYVGCIVDYLEKLAELGGSDSDAGPHYRLRGRGSTRVADELVIDRFEARVEPPGGSDS